MFTRMRLGRSLCVAGAMLTLGGATLGGLGATTIATALAPTITDEYGPIPTDAPATTDEYGPIPTDAPTAKAAATTVVTTTTEAVGSEAPLPTTTTTTIAPNVASEAPNPPTLPATGSRSAGAAAMLGLFLLAAGLVVSGLSRRTRSLES